MQIVRRNFQIVAALAFVFAGQCSTLFAQSAQQKSTQPNDDKSEKQAAKPVIVLTGFEPFGPQKPPNPSWEGIRELNGREIGGFQIVSHQVPVIWGEPRKHLDKLIEEHHPVAIFSFGQGGQGSFAIESQAMNTRAEYRDNAGKTPPEPTITKDGPQLFEASFPYDKMKDLLSKKGYPIRVSTVAGQYLCEETLYSLEYIRRQKEKSIVVSFCHVPPLGTHVGENNETLVDRAYVQKFVEDYLESWQELQSQKAEPKTGDKAADPALAPCGLDPNDERPVGPQKGPSKEAEKHPDQAAVEELIERYFESWSEQRMKDYGACFADDAVIQELNSRKDIHTQSKGPFVATQSTYHKMALFKATEIPVKTTITFEAELARAVVYWKLTAGPRKQFGYDHFTLVKQDGEWKIANLVFYGTNDKE